jgi:hypothetical protein
MASIRTFITDRRAEITREIEILRAELLDLDKAEAALAEPPPGKELAGAQPNTFKGMALFVLRMHSPLGLDANQIRTAMERVFGLKVERSSLSPQLSRLKRDGILVLEGKMWRRVGALHKEALYLPPPKENGPSELSPDGPETRSKDGSDPSEEHINPSQQDIF